MNPSLCRSAGRVLWSALLLVLAVTLASCDGRSGGPAGETTLERIRRTGVVRIGYANEAPFGYQDPATGRVTGEAPEVARAVLDRLGVKQVEATLADFGQLIPALRADRFDIIAAGMYITPERAQQIRFSNPTYSIGEAFLVRAGNPKSLHSFEDVLRHEDAMLGVVGGAIELQIAEQLKIPSERIVVFPDNAAALAGLRASRIDAFAGTALTVQDLLAKSPSGELERADPFHQPQIAGRQRSYGAFGFRMEDQALADAFNKELASFIGSPEHLELVRAFGFTEEELPGDVTAEQLIQQAQP